MAEGGGSTDGEALSLVDEPPIALPNKNVVQRYEEGSKPERCPISVNPSIQETADQIADQLGETKPSPREKIRQIVETCGIEQALAWLQETLDIEANGGLMVNSGERRRTPGGVFFYLVKGRLPNNLRRKLFPYRPKKPKKKSAQQSAARGSTQEIVMEPALGSENTVRLEELRKAEQAAMERLSAIQALPPSERIGLMSALKELQKIRAEIRRFQS